MKHEEPPSGGGPYRGEIPTTEIEDPKITEMKRQIEAEGKQGILIPENIKEGDEFPEFSELLKQGADKQKIILYSLSTGILAYQPGAGDRLPKQKYYFYGSNVHDDHKIYLTILVDKKIARICNIDTWPK